MARPRDAGFNLVSYLGKKYHIVRKADEKLPIGRILLSFEDENAVFRYNPVAMTDEKLEKYLEKYWRGEAKRLVVPLLTKWEYITGLKPAKVSFRSSKSRWGSCSGRGNVSFSIYLAKLSVESIEYVVVHELCHLKHHNHSELFWAEVAKFLPDYAARRSAMKSSV